MRVIYLLVESRLLVRRGGCFRFVVLTRLEQFELARLVSPRLALVLLRLALVVLKQVLLRRVEL